MKRSFLIAVVCLLASSAWGMQQWQGYCQRGGQTVTIGSLGTSLSTFMQTYPACTVTVYNSDGVTLSTIYSDNGITPKANPFTADATTGYAFFFAAQGFYEVKFSGAGITTYTLSNQLLFDPSDNVTLTNATLITPTITNPAVTTGTFTSPAITGGTINNAVIGGSTPAAVTGTTITANTTFTGPIGGASPNTGAFTTVTAKTLNDVIVVDPTMTTAQIQTQLTAAASANAYLYFRPGTYSLVETFQVTNEFTFYGVFQMANNMHILCDRGAVLQLAAGQSTDGAPKDISMFAAGTSVSNVSIYGCTIDMNYPNNKISPNRGVSYNAYNFAHIRVSGTNVTMTDADFEYNTFLNTPGATCIGLGQSNVAASALSSRITISHNLFKDNGMDTSDFSCIYGWATNLDVHDNVFTQTTPAPTESPFVGTFMAVELHGANSTFHHNRVYNYAGGGYVANNYTSLVSNVDFGNNQLWVSWIGVKFFNSGTSPASVGVSDIHVHDNVIQFIETAYTGSPNRGIGFDLETTLGLTDITFSNNRVFKTGAQTIPVQMALLAPATGKTYADIRFLGNTGDNITQGIVADTSLSGGAVGYLEASDNHFYDLLPVSPLTTSVGINVVATNGVATLKLNNNSFVDEQGGGATFQKGIIVSGGTVTDYYLGPQVYKGLTSTTYTQTSTITNLLGATFGGTVTAPSLVATTSITSPLTLTTTNCTSSASPAVCAAAPAGTVVVAAAASTVVVNTTAVTANSEIFLTRDDSLGTKLSVTCNTATAAGDIKVSARTASTSFTITVQNAPSVNPLCLSYRIVN